jgi:hypothetical protein
MTIRDRGFWVYLLGILIVGAGLWLAVFLTLYHPTLEPRNSLVVQQ